MLSFMFTWEAESYKYSCQNLDMFTAVWLDNPP